MFNFLYTFLLAFLLSNTINNYAMEQAGLPANELPAQLSSQSPQNPVLGLEEEVDENDSDPELDRKTEMNNQVIKTLESANEQKKLRYLALRYARKSLHRENKLAGYSNVTSDPDSDSDSSSDSDSEIDSEPPLAEIKLSGVKNEITFEEVRQSNYRDNSSTKKTSESKNSNKLNNKFKINDSVYWGVGITSLVIYFIYRYLTLPEEYFHPDDEK